VAFLILALASPAWATDYTWDPGPDNDLWSTADNWTPSGGPPGPSDNAIINSGTPVVDLPFAVNELTVGSSGVVDIVDARLTVKSIDNNGEIRLGPLGFGGQLEFEGAVTYQGSGAVKASNTAGNALLRKFSTDLLTVAGGTILRMESISGPGRLDVEIPLKILPLGAVEYSNLTGEMPNGLISDGELEIRLGSALEIRSSVGSLQAVRGVLDVGTNASLVLNSAQVIGQELITTGQIEIRGGTLVNCIAITGESPRITASTTLESECNCNLDLAEGVTLAISGDVVFEGTIMAEGTASLSRLNNGVLLLDGALVNLGAGTSLVVGVPIRPDAPPGPLPVGIVDITEGAVQLTHPVGTDLGPSITVGVEVGATLELDSTIYKGIISVGGELMLAGAIDSGTVLGPGLILGEGGTLRSVELSAAAAIEGSGAFAQSLRLEGSMGENPNSSSTALPARRSSSQEIRCSSPH
jgi:hypothetical protein